MATDQRAARLLKITLRAPNELTLSIQCVAEGVGAALLMSGAVASVILPERLWAFDEERLGFEPIICALIVAALTALGNRAGDAQFNPILSLDAVCRGKLPLTRGAAHAAAQVAGGCLGVIATQAALNLDPIQAPLDAPLLPAAIAAEFAAAFLFVAAVRLARVAFKSAVARGIMAGSAFILLNALTPYRSFANPATAVARSLTSNSLSLSQHQAIVVIAAELLGAVAASIVLARRL